MEKQRGAGMTFSYAVLILPYWTAYAVVWPYIATLLTGFGTTAVQIGLVTSLAAVLEICLQPLLSGVADRSRFWDSRRVCVLLLSGAALAALGASLLYRVGRWLTCLLFILLCVCVTSAPPYYNAIAMRLELQGRRLNYGAARGLGSAVYALVTFAVGNAADALTPPRQLQLFALLAAAAVAAAIWFRRRMPCREGESAAAPQISARALVRQNPRFGGMMLACTLLLASHSVYATYMNSILQNIHCGSHELGIAFGISAAVELPAMLLFNLLKKRFSCGGMLRLCSVFFAVKVLFFLSARSVWLIYIAQLFQLLEYGIYLPAAVYYVSETVGSSHQAKGQALLHVAGSGVGTALGSLSGGIILEKAGLTAALLWALFMALSGVALVFHFTARPRRSLRSRP